MNQLQPRDIADQLCELTAIVETLRVAVAAVATAISENNDTMGRIMWFYDREVVDPESISLGLDRSEQYLKYLKDHVKKTRHFVAVG